MMRIRSFLVFLVILISIVQCTSQKTSAYKLKISHFIEGSNLEKAGAQKGDYLLKYNGKDVLSLEHLIKLRNKATGKMVKVLLRRNDIEIEIEIPNGQLGVTFKEYFPNHEIAKDAVLIEGIEKLEWGSGRDNSFLACVFLLEQKFGSAISYQNLIGISGYGFRLQFFDRFCASSPDATVGFDAGSFLLSQLGYRFRYYHSETLKSEELSGEYYSEAEMRRVIIESIDRGFPVIAIDLIETPEWGLITGYQKKGNEFFCRTYFDKTAGYEIAQKFPWSILVLEEKIEPDIASLFKESLELAEVLYATPKYDNYFSGLRAVEEWIKALRDEQYFIKNFYRLAEISHANWWIFVSLQMARAVSSSYLSENIEMFQSDPKLLNQLIEIYQQEAALLIDNFEILPDQNETWTAEMRAKQIIVLEDFLKLEEKAYEILKSI